MATKDTGKVNIHGKEYTTVAARVNTFREAFAYDFSLTTEIVSVDDKVVIMKAYITSKDGRVIATGHAEEQRSSSQINRTSALENAETSAIGRALAAFGIGGTEFASANEVQNAVHQQAAPAKSWPEVRDAAEAGRTAAQQPTSIRVTEGQVKLLLARARDASGLQDREDILAWFHDNFGDPTQVLKADVNRILEDMSSMSKDQPTSITN